MSKPHNIKPTDGNLQDQTVQKKGGTVLALELTSERARGGSAPSGLFWHRSPLIGGFKDGCGMRPLEELSRQETIS